MIRRYTGTLVPEGVIRVDKFKPEREQVKFNYLAGKSRYYLLTDKTGCPSADFRCRRGNEMVVPETRPSSADP